MIFKVNLFEDFCELVKDWARKGVALNKLSVKGMPKDDKGVQAWINKNAISSGFEICSQKLTVRPRAVTVSPSFLCPDNLKSKFEEIKRHIKNGDDLNPYLGNTLNRLGSHDPMLANWGIRHFHTMPAGQRVRGRDNALIFAWLSADEAYIIAIGTHADFSNTEYLKDLQRNHPAALGPEVNETGLDVDSDEYKRLLSLCINTAVRINGHVYYCPGGGRNADGCSTRGCIDAIVLRRRLDAASKVLREGLDDALKRLLPIEQIIPVGSEPLNVRLQQFDGKEIRVACPELGLTLSLLDTECKIAVVDESTA